MKNAKKWICNGLICVVLFAATLGYLLHDQNFSGVLARLRQADPGWCMVGLGLSIAFVLGESCIIWYLMRAVGQHVRITHCFLYSFVGFFVSAITPSASGGQPAQLYFMKKDRISLAVGIPVLTVVTILYKSVLIVADAAVLIFRPAAVMPYLASHIGWIRLGLGLNAAFVSALLLLVFRPEIARRLAYGAIHLIGVVTRRPNRTQWMARVDAGIEKYRLVSMHFAHNARTICTAFAMTLVQRTLLFAIPWCCCAAYRLRHVSIGLCITLQAMVASAADMMPLPGGTGVNEALFRGIFDGLLGSQLTLPILLLSRGLSFYVQLLVGAGMTAVAALLLGRPPTRRASHNSTEKDETHS